MGTAARWTRWKERGERQPASVPASAQPVGTPILTGQFGNRVYLSVQIAWGATPLSDITQWNWTDVTHSVLFSDQVKMTLGRADETSTAQPANLTFTLKNSLGDYSRGGQSRNYPNVERGVPVRVLVSVDGVPNTRFLGYVVGFPPAWDTTGNFSVVKITAAGTKRRLQQRKSVVQSVLVRSIPSLANLIGYWPCEDGALSTQLVSSSGLGQPITLSGMTNLASYTGFYASNAIPTFSSDSWSGWIPTYIDSGNFSFSFLLFTPQNGIADQTTIVHLYTSGAIAGVELRYSGTPSQGGLRLLAYGPTGTVLGDSGTQLYGVAGVPVRIQMDWSRSGGNTTIRLVSLVQGTGGGATNSITVNSATIVRVNNFVFNTAGGTVLQGVAIGQVYCQNVQANLFQNFAQFNGYIGEYARVRASRLVTENGELMSYKVGTSWAQMGPQTPDILLTLLENAALVEQALLYDGLAQGLTWVNNFDRLNQRPALILDASRAAHGQLGDPVDPHDDDQLIQNMYTASRISGSNYTFSDTTDSLSVTQVGTYDGSGQFSFMNDKGQLESYAQWKVHLGTVPGYRFPTVGFLLHRNPELLQTWLATGLWSRIDLINISNVRSQFNSAAVKLLLQGYTETIDKFTWEVMCNTTQYAPHEVSEYALATGDQSSWAGRYETPGTTVQTGCDVGGTSITVLTQGNVLWTTNSDDFPVAVNIAGNEVFVTNITGTTPGSPQTMTLSSAATQPIPSGAAVSLWLDTSISCYMTWQMAI